MGARILALSAVFADTADDFSSWAVVVAHEEASRSFETRPETGTIEIATATGGDCSQHNQFR